MFLAALKYSFPVMLGYAAIGFAFGLMMAGAGYPWWLSLVMSVLMYAGAGQYIGVGLFAAGAGLWEAALVQLVVNARHIAYGLSMISRFQAAGPFKYYLIFSLTDETFALLSSLPKDAGDARRGPGPFMFLVALLDQGYWVAGSVLGAVAGALIPFNFEGVSFALTALFIVLLIEQVLRARSALPRRRSWAAPFLASAPAAVLAVLLLPARFSLLSAMAAAIALSWLAERRD